MKKFAINLLNGATLRARIYFTYADDLTGAQANARDAFPGATWRIVGGYEC